ncbi:hypothetical protein CLNEO_10880 [Anaerotignum neopropionicum]|uniref:Uncharacterized protein n=1 Tax=Anaerotignum neopropionicum TaxID=36847 RepID=A0A136WH59_9FIRM|nr:hypothetical protein [Anaerotignum neopropionicum]KXL53862.1 hypothetical protein CLNEO_10880 [Anaerotignum neopropionicum]
MEQDKTSIYVDYLNQKVLPAINYDRLQASYGTQDKDYAKAVLHLLHQAMVHCYGTDYLTEGVTDYVMVPGVVQSKEKGNLCIALLELDLTSSGEHYETKFLTGYGILPQSDPELPDHIRAYIRDTFIPYDYGYTAAIPSDIHVNKSSLPEAVREMLSTFQNHVAILESAPEMSEQEELER